MAAGEGDSTLARTARGAGWMMGWRAATRLLGLVSTLVLVRILLPEDFGLVALATTFAVALEVLIELGLEDQIIRARITDRDLFDTAFTMNLIRAVAVALMVAAAAPFAGEFFGDARLETVLLILAAATVVSGLKNLGVVEFRRNLDFAREFQLMILPRVVSVVATIVLAFVLQSYWALVIGIVIQRVGTVAMSYAVHPYRPALSLALWREMVGVSFWTWAHGVLALVRERADSLAIGRMQGPAPVGIYAVGVEIAALPTTEMVDPICRAAMPGFAETLRRQGDPGAAEALLRITALIAMMTIPASLGISAIAGPLVLAAFGPNWLGAVPVVAILGAACVTLFGRVALTLLRACAMLRTLCAIAGITMVLRVALLVALIPDYGLAGAAIAYAVSLVAEQALALHIAMRRVGLGPGALLAGIWRPAAAAAAMAAVLWLTGLGWAGPPPTTLTALWLLAAIPAVGAAVFVAVAWVLWALGGFGPGAERDTLRVLRDALAGPLRRLGAARVALRGRLRGAARPS
jgi:O-antigen/teichoic acid export membrane protein